MNYKYKSLTEFRKDHPKLYSQLYYRNEVIKLCKEMGWKIKKPNNYWTKERCIEEAKKYNTLTQFKKGNSTAYNLSLNNNWMTEISELCNFKKPKGYWTKESCIEEAKQYNNLAELRKNNQLYYAVDKNNWVDEICELYNWERLNKKPNGYWTKERCFEEAKQYNNLAELRKNKHRIYNVLLDKNYLNELCELMNWSIQKTKPNGYWTKERCIEEAKQYNNLSEFRKNALTVYQITYKHNWIYEICELLNWTISRRKKN